MSSDRIQNVLQIKALFQQIERAGYPIPPPEELEKYRQIDSDFLGWFKKGRDDQTNHRQTLENRDNWAKNIQRFAGMACSLVIMLGVLYLSYLTIQAGYILSTLGFILMVFGGIGWIFMKRYPATKLPDHSKKAEKK